MRPLDTIAAQPLAGTDGATYPFWSPDSRSIAFFADNKLKRLNLSGGAPQTLAPANNGSGGTWNADDVIVFAPTTTTPLMRVPGSGGSAVPVTTMVAALVTTGTGFTTGRAGAVVSAGVVRKLKSLTLFGGVCSGLPLRDRNDRCLFP